MTTAPAGTTATTTPGPGTRPGPKPPTRAEKTLTGIVVAAVVVISALGFVGSYHAVTALAIHKGFGWFANVFPTAIDAGIVAFLALDLLLTWRRMPYPLLRPAAWLLTAATIAFNGAAAWPDPLGVGMHAVIPVLFIIAVEAARHAIGRTADITADRHIESPPLIRWFVDPIGTFRIWRRMRIWHIRSYEDVIEHQRQARVYRAKLRKEHGRRWRRVARAEQLLVLQLAAGGMTIADAIALPEKEAEAQRAAAEKRAEDARQAENRRQQELRDQRRREEDEQRDRERRQREADAEAARAEAEELRRQEADERERRLADAKAQAELDAIDNERRRKAEALRQEEWEREQERKRSEEQAAIDAAEKLASIDAKRAVDAEAARKAARETADQAERARQEREKAMAIEAAVRAQQVRETANTNLNANLNANSRTGGTRTGERPANRERRNANSTANLSDRAATKRTQIANVLSLIDELGFDATTLGVVQERTGMTKTTAYHRLTEAREIWNRREAS